MTDNGRSGGVIAPYPTDRTSNAHRQQSGERDARIRAELAEQIAASQSLLESQIDSLRHAASQGGDSATLASAEQQLAMLAGLQRHVAQGGDVATVSMSAGCGKIGDGFTSRVARQPSASATHQQKRFLGPCQQTAIVAPGLIPTFAEFQHSYYS